MSTIDDAFTAIDRADFVLLTAKDAAYDDRPLPIGHGQTISQPSTVRKMLEWLDVQPGQHVLDIGSGSGWTTALLSHLVGPKGQVDAVDVIPELVEMGRTNCKKLDLQNVRFSLTSNVLGLPQFAPYDRILVSAAGESIDEQLYTQVTPGGKIVIPIHNSILEITHTDTRPRITEHYGYIFVPLL